MGLQGGLGWLCAAAMAALTMLAAPAQAAELTRRDFVDRAEPICEAATVKVSPSLKVGLAEFKRNDVKSAGPKFTQAAATYDSLRARLADIPKPPEDAEVLTEWLKQLGVQNLFMRKTGQALSAGQRVKAQGYLSRFVHNGNLANDMVLGFGLKDCLFDSRLRSATDACKQLSPPRWRWFSSPRSRPAGQWPSGPPPAT